MVQLLRLLEDLMKEAITEYIPQREPMIMIGTMVAASNTTAETSFLIPNDNIFVEDGVLTAEGLIENIAQTAASMVGYHCKQDHKPVPLGYIAAVKELKINSLPNAGSTIRTKVAITNEILEITIIDGVITQSDEIICSCEMKIVIEKS
jgi:3-hydroxyacyl-[acyl-carrier-protein] dehydratase